MEETRGLEDLSRELFLEINEMRLEKVNFVIIWCKGHILFFTGKIGIFGYIAGKIL
jgi:hypothetical protein